MDKVPFVGLRPFDVEDQDLFFGRERSNEIVLSLIYSSPIILVFGPSGVGKSSLLRAGVIPKLASDEFLEVNYVDSWIDGFQCAIASKLDDPVYGQGTRSMLQTLQARSEEHNRHVVLLLDQFEDILKGSGDLEPVDLDTIWDQLAEVVAARHGPATVVVSLREDYLADLDGLAQRVGGLLEGGFRVPALSRDDLSRAVTGPLGKLNPPAYVEADLLEDVLRDLSGRDSRSSGLNVEPGYFQIVWATLWQEDTNRSDRTITRASYERLGKADEIVRSYMSTTIHAVLSQEDRHLLFAMGRYMVLASGAKVGMSVQDLAFQIQPYDFTELARLQGIIPEDDFGAFFRAEKLAPKLATVLDRLATQDAPFFRRESRGTSIRYELLHDLLGQILLDWRDEFSWECRQELRMTVPYDDLAQKVRRVTALEASLEGSLPQWEEVANSRDHDKQLTLIEDMKRFVDDWSDLRSDLTGRIGLILDSLAASEYGDVKKRTQNIRSRIQRAGSVPLSLPTWTRVSTLRTQRDPQRPRPSLLKVAVGWLVLCAISAGGSDSVARLLLTDAGLSSGRVVTVLVIAVVWCGLYLYDTIDNPPLSSRFTHAFVTSPLRPIAMGLGTFEKLSAWPINFVGQALIANVAFAAAKSFSLNPTIFYLAGSVAGVILFAVSYSQAGLLF